MKIPHQTDVGLPNLSKKQQFIWLPLLSSTKEPIFCLAFFFLDSLQFKFLIILSGDLACIFMLSFLPPSRKEFVELFSTRVSKSSFPGLTGCQGPLVCSDLTKSTHKTNFQLVNFLKNK